MEKLLTAKEVAELLSIDESTVYKWVDQGRLSYVDLGKRDGKRCIRFRLKDMEQLVASKLVSAR